MISTISTLIDEKILWSDYKYFKFPLINSDNTYTRI